MFVANVPGEHAWHAYALQFSRSQSWIREAGQGSAVQDVTACVCVLQVGACICGACVLSVNVCNLYVCVCAGMCLSVWFGGLGHDAVHQAVQGLDVWQLSEWCIKSGLSKAAAALQIAVACRR